MGKTGIIDSLEAAIKESLESQEVKSRLFSKSAFSMYRYGPKSSGRLKLQQSHLSLPYCIVSRDSSDVDNGRLIEGLRPLRVELERLDAELFLKLEQVNQGGACLCQK